MGPVPKSDIKAAQVLVLAPLLAVMFAIGWYPNALTQLMTSLGQAGLYK
jgi:NADH:ubiquinone oxidoreductase subunit 4 (subunit M)